MNAQEIVNILKENKIKGIAFYFLSEDIQDWIHDNFDNSNLLYFDSMGNWQYFKYSDFDDYDNVVFALPDMFELPPKPQGGWVEFDINEDGGFMFEPEDTDGLAGVVTWWWNWQQFLLVSAENDLGFTAFGGWQYKDDSLFYMYPVVNFYKDDSEQHCVPDHAQAYDGETDDVVEPAIPIKIRFWREAK